MAEAGGGPTKEQLVPIEAAFNELYKGLVEAKQLFDQTNEREAAIHALECVLKFLEKSSKVQSYGLHAPLVALFDALMSLDDGEVRPILKKALRTGRGRASALRDSIKGAAAFTVKALHATGLPMPAAYKQVARLLQKAGVTAERGRYQGITVRTVRGWCEDVAADVSRQGEAAQTFDLLQKEVQALNDPRTIELNLLNLIRQTAGSKKPVNPLP
jgi:hypothetical protein